MGSQQSGDVISLPRRAISAHLLPAFDADSKRKEYVLLLGKDPRLHVKTKAAQTSTLGLQPEDSFCRAPVVDVSSHL